MAELPISNQIRMLRFMAGEMTQAELGERIGMTRQTIAAIEQGKYSPAINVAFRIAHVFGKPIDEVFRWSPSAEDGAAENEGASATGA